MSVMELFENKPCIQCGYSCTVEICIHGKRDGEKGPCAYLDTEKGYSCTIRDEIMDREKDWPPHMRVMGRGCVSPKVNEMRRVRISEILEMDPMELKRLEEA